jgi:hypothetical protein
MAVFVADGEEVASVNMVRSVSYSSAHFYELDITCSFSSHHS